MTQRDKLQDLQNDTFEPGISDVIAKHHSPNVDAIISISNIRGRVRHESHQDDEDDVELRTTVERSEGGMNDAGALSTYNFHHLAQIHADRDELTLMRLGHLNPNFRCCFFFR